jgi:hypothetical protein
VRSRRCGREQYTLHLFSYVRDRRILVCETCRSVFSFQFWDGGSTPFLRFYKTFKDFFRFTHFWKFWHKGPPAPMNCQKRSLLNEIAKKRPPFGGGRTCQATRGGRPAALACGGTLVRTASTLIGNGRCGPCRLSSWRLGEMEG